jgi:hypothetical protein
MKFRKKPVVIEATQFTGDNGDAIAAFMGCQHPFIENGGLMIGTLEGVHRANPGDWIIKGVKGEFYPCKPDIFAATYEPAQDIANEEHQEQGFKKCSCSIGYNPECQWEGHNRA